MYKGTYTMAKNWYPIINYDNCIECGACVEKCKHGVYEKDGDRPVVVYPEGCVEGCHGCQNLCPAEAITYYGEVDECQSGACKAGCNCDGGCDCK